MNGHSHKLSEVNYSTVRKAKENIEMEEDDWYEKVTPLNQEPVLQVQPRDVKLSKHIKLLYVVVAVVTVMVIGACACIVAAHIEIWKLRSGAREPSLAMTANGVDLDALLENATKFYVKNGTFLDTIQLFDKNISNISTALEAIAKSITETFANQSTAIAQILDDVQIFHTFASCANISSSLPSGYYYIRSSNEFTARVYCDMTRSCGGITGGWMRAADLDMRNSNARCPSGLEEMTYSGNIRTCIQKSNSSGCSSDIDYTTHGNSYSHVCGMIRGYQYGSPDGFQRQFDSTPSNPTSADSNYVDGVSLTHGMNHGQHIWTFAAGPCHCSTNQPSFLGTDFTCDGVDYTMCSGFCNVVLWDGVSCGDSPNTPWIYKQLPQPTTEDIQMRVCRDQESDDEVVAIERIEMFVQ